MGIAGIVILSLAFGVEAVLSAQCPASGTPILTYHRFAQNSAGKTTVTQSHLLEQWARLKEQGYRFAALNVIEEAIARHQPLPAEDVIVTVDDGHESVYTVLFPILQEQHVPVTLFIYPSIISRRPDALTWQQLKEMQATGLVRIESHTYWHPDFRKEKRRLSAADYVRFVQDQLSRSKGILEKKLGVPIHSLAWPYGIVDPELEEAAHVAGYSYAYGFDGRRATALDDAYAIHRIPVPDSAGIGFLACEKVRHDAKKAQRR